MSVQSDGIDEALQGVSQVAMTGAARIGERVAREMEDRARREKARSEQAAAELAERLKAEREAARASLAPVHRDEWWDTARAEDVTKAYTTAHAWRDLDPEAARAERRIASEVQSRYGVEIPVDADEASVREALDRSRAAGEDSEHERGAAADETSEAAALLAQADAADAAAEAHRTEEDERIRAAEEKVRESEERFSDNPYRSPEETERLTAERDDARAELDALLHGGSDAPEQETTAEREAAAERESEAAPAYDSVERREQTARELHGIENREAVEARMTADVAQGRPATDAVRQKPGRAPKARRSRGVDGQQREAQLGR